MSLRNPVKYPVKYYSWQDDQAPQLSNADGVIKTILKACLVTGYGSKAGAGWTSLFEDAYRIVLRRPLLTGNPPDIKIENGTITGTTVRHRIVSQDNPTSLDDATELSAVNLLARDQNLKPEWHCIVTDFAFLLCYQMGSNSNASADRNNILFVGSAQKLNDADIEYFFANYQSSIAANGTIGVNYPFISTATIIKNMRANKDYTVKNVLSLNLPEKFANNDFFAQKIMIDSVAMMPFYTAVSQQYADKVNSIVSIAGRQCLRWVNLTLNGGSENKVLYIPLDYWEL